jgi:hypothetical protein
MVQTAHTGNSIERTAILTVHHWLSGLPVPTRPAERTEYAQLIEELIRLSADSTERFDPTPHLLAERYIRRGLLAVPGQWLPERITRPGEDKDAVTTEADLVGFAWTVPWERERTRRLVGLVYDPAYPAGRFSLIHGRPGAGLLNVRSTTAVELIDVDRSLCVYRRATCLTLAARLYHIKYGHFPTTLDELVAGGCLPALPLDPFDDHPLRFRISQGEELVPPRRGPGSMQVIQTFPPSLPPITVARGQPIIWSVGPDKVDNGGMSPGAGGNAPRQDDWLFVVPLPKPR